MLTMLGMKPVKFLSESDFAKSITVQSEMFSLYAVGIVKGYKREIAVVDRRGARLPESARRAGAFASIYHGGRRVRFGNRVRDGATEREPVERGGSDYFGYGGQSGRTGDLLPRGLRERLRLPLAIEPEAVASAREKHEMSTWLGLDIGRSKVKAALVRSAYRKVSLEAISSVDVDGDGGSSMPPSGPRSERCSAR